MLNVIDEFTREALSLDVGFNVKGYDVIDELRYVVERWFSLMILVKNIMSQREGKLSLTLDRNVQDAHQTLGVKTGKRLE